MALLGCEPGECLLEGQAATVEPGPHAIFGERVQADHSATPIVRVFAPLHKLVRLQLGRQLAGRGQREAEFASEVADRALALRADVREHGDVPAAQVGLALDELEQLRRRAPPGPEPAHHPPQQAAQLAQLGSGRPAGNRYASVLVIIE